MKIPMLIGFVLMLAVSGMCSEDFKDVPEDHWAADAVSVLADADVVQGYPDGTYRGDQPVTRYELAVALAAMVQYIQQSREPLTCKPTDASGKAAHWAADSLGFLRSEKVLPPDSPILQGGDGVVTASELADALVSTAAKLVETAVPPTNSES